MLNEKALALRQAPLESVPCIQDNVTEDYIMQESYLMLLVEN